MTKLTLDHVGLVSPDLKLAYEDYRGLGFLLTRESSHRGRLTPDGNEELWGSGNHCAMFREGYLELLGITDPNRPHGSVLENIDRFHGMQLVALGCTDAAALHESRNESPGASRLCPPVDVGRDVPVGLDGQETEPALFRIVHPQADAFPEADLLFIEQATPDALWQEALLDHPNGVLGLTGATICSSEPEVTAERFQAITGHEGLTAGSGFRFDLERGFVEIVPPSQVTTEFPGAILPAIPCVAAASFAVDKPKQTEAFLRGQDVTVHRSPKGLWVSPERAGGVVLEFLDG